MSTRPPFQLGLYSFGENTPLYPSSRTISAEERFNNLVEEIVLADQLGLDVFGLGEHHRSDYLVSAPAMILAAAAARTSNIRLTSAVTVLSSEDPVRVFQQFATLDLISRGRAEIMAGRGSFIESFPLFGYDLQDYDELFEEKLELLLELRQDAPVTWSGKHRSSLTDQLVYPRPVQKLLPVWLAVGGTPQSLVRAARHDLPLALAIIGGQASAFQPFAEHYRNALQHFGHTPKPISLNMHGYLADDSKRAGDEYFPALAGGMNQIGRERGWGPMSREQFEASRVLDGANLVGTPDELIERILFHHELFDHDRFLLQISVGSVPHDKMMHAIELYGSKVAPVVREEIARRRA